jgi:hypothetical protein
MSELVLKSAFPVQPHTPYSITVGSEPVMMRVEELLVKTPEHFDILSLCIGAKVIIGERVPAVTFSDEALPMLRQLLPTVLHPWPTMSVVMMIENNSDTARDFEAVLKGRSSS